MHRPTSTKFVSATPSARGVAGILTLVSAAALSGCVGLPATRNTAGFAVSGSSLEDPAPTFEGEASIRPLGAFETFGDRPADAGIGVFASYAARADEVAGDLESTWLVGPSVSAEGYPITFEDGARVVVGGSLRSLYDTKRDAWGPFAGPQFGVEIMEYTEGCDTSADSGIWLMCGAGEVGVGAYVNGHVGVIEGDIYYSTGLSVSLRVPAGFVGGIPLPW